MLVKVCEKKLGDVLAGLWCKTEDPGAWEVELIEEEDGVGDACIHVGLTFERVVPLVWGSAERPLGGLVLEDYDGVFALSLPLVEWLRELGALVREEFEP